MVGDCFLSSVDLFLCSDGRDIVLSSYWLVTVSSVALTCNLFRWWKYCTFVIMVGDSFLSSIDLFFVHMVEMLYFRHNGCSLFPQQCSLVLCSDSGNIVLFSWWLVTVSLAVLTCSLFRWWRYCTFIIIVDDCFLSVVDLFFVQIVEC